MAQWPVRPMPMAAQVAACMSDNGVAVATLRFRGVWKDAGPGI
jgi:hypothetical protein